MLRAGLFAQILRLAWKQQFRAEVMQHKGCEGLGRWQRLMMMVSAMAIKRVVWKALAHASLGPTLLANRSAIACIGLGRKAVTLAPSVGAESGILLNLAALFMSAGRLEDALAVTEECIRLSAQEGLQSTALYAGLPFTHSLLWRPCSTHVPSRICTSPLSILLFPHLLFGI